MSSMSITIAADDVEPAASDGHDYHRTRSLRKTARIVAVRVNGELGDLHRTLPEEAVVEPVTIDSPDGLNILRHSTAHVAAQAVQSLHPDAKLGIGPPDHRRVLLRLRRGSPVHS